MNEPISTIMTKDVVTVHPDEVFFEAFSVDESSFARVGVSREVMSDDGDVVFGTTNIDFSKALARHLDPDAWVRAIAGITGNAARYDDLAAKARAHADRDDFKPQEAARRFLAFCSEPAHFRRPLGLTLRAGLGRLLGRAA